MLVLTLVSVVALVASFFSLEVSSAVLFVASVAWILETVEILGYAIFYNAFSQIPVILLLIIAIVASVSLFFSAYFWNRFAGKKPTFKKLLLLWFCLMLFPMASYFYKTYSRDDFSYKVYINRCGDFGIELSDADALPYRVTIPDTAVFMQLWQNAPSGECKKCKVRITNLFQKKTLKFIYSDDTDTYFDDEPEISFPDDCRASFLEMKVKDLRW